ncbi:MAG: TetR/AcrR family transcriptional regulator [Desulfovibrio sp.]|jgi:AcrR family transcriptional regulator|nr:TetR/AcrR family transcriptional regulator [Desulfovibrio sp.]
MRSKTFENLAPEKQERVLDTAVEEFAQHGFHQASVNRMVKQLGIAKGSLFKYFGSKEGLFQHVFEHAVDLFKGPLKAARNAEGDTFDRLRLSLMAGLEFVQQHPRLYRIYLKVLFQENVPFREPFLQQVRGYSAKFLRPLLEDGMRRGELRADLDLDMAVFLIDGLFDRLLQSLTVPEVHPALHGLSQGDARQRIDQLMDFIRRALAANNGEQHA